MAATDIEVTVYDVSVTSGTAQLNQTLGTVNGAVKNISITKVRDSGDIQDYQVAVVHDDVSTTVLEYSVITITKTKGTALVDTSVGAINGVSQQSTVVRTRSNSDRVTSDVLVVHLAS